MLLVYKYNSMYGNVMAKEAKLRLCKRLITIIIIINFEKWPRGVEIFPI